LTPIVARNQRKFAPKSSPIQIRISTFACFSILGMPPILDFDDLSWAKKLT